METLRSSKVSAPWRRCVAATLLVLYLPGCYGWRRTERPLVEVIPVSPDSGAPWIPTGPSLIDVVLADESRIPVIQPEFTGDSLHGFRPFRAVERRNRVVAVDSAWIGFSLSEVYGFVRADPPRRIMIDEFGRAVEDTRRVRVHLDDGSRITMTSPVQAERWVWGGVSEWLRPLASEPDYWSRADFVPLAGVPIRAITTVETRRLDPGKTLAAILIGVPAVAALVLMTAVLIACQATQDNSGCLPGA